MRTKAGVLAALIALVVMGLPAAAEEGALWVPALPSQYQGYNYLSLFDDGTGYSYRSNGTDNGPLFVTGDFGATWSLGTLPPFGASTGAVAFGSPDVGYGVGIKTLFRSTDAAASWAPVPMPVTGVDGRTEEFDVVDADTLVLGRTVVPPPPDGEDCTPARLRKPEIAITRDGGLTWDTEELTDTLVRIRAIASDGERVAVLTSPVDMTNPEACGFGGGGPAPDTVWVRDAETGSYRSVFTCVEGQECRDLAWAGDVLVSIANFGWVHRSADGGATWTTSRVMGIASTTVPGHPWPGGIPDGIDFADDQVGYASFNANGIWRTDDAGATWVMETSAHEVLGIAGGSIAVADRDHALAGGPNAVHRRVPRESP